MSQKVGMREYERMALDALASVTDGCIETPAIGIDASPAGIGLRSAFLWEPGTRVTVQLELADSTIAVALAVVQRVAGDVMGLRLVAHGPAFARLLGAQAA